MPTAAPAQTQTQPDAGPVGAPLAGAPLPTRPLGIVEVVDAGIDILRFRLRRFIGMGVVILLPIAALTAVVAALVFSAEAEPVADDAAAVLAALITSQLSVFAIQGLLFVSTGFFGVGVGAAVAAWHEGRDPNVWELLAVVLRRTPVFLVAWLSGFVLKVAAGSACTGVLWPVANAFLMPLAPIIGGERLGPFAALSRSFRLAGGSFGHAVGVSVAGTIVAIAVQFAVLVGPAAASGLVLDGGAGTDPDVLLIVALGVASLLAALLVLIVVPLLSASIATALHLNLDMRSAGADLEAERQRLAA